jgi:hypothetical protein
LFAIATRFALAKMHSRIFPNCRTNFFAFVFHYEIAHKSTIKIVTNYAPLNYNQNVDSQKSAPCDTGKSSLGGRLICLLIDGFKNPEGT